jgi:hypothetical protein
MSDWRIRLFGHFAEAPRAPPEAASARARDGKSGAAFRQPEYGETTFR